MARRKRPRVDKKRVEAARFRQLYASRDGRLCVFEDEKGHLTCVRASRLA
ncbi:hypothetical protein [Berryella intestinalis]|nr:hypothetical protein [Berryella intestinalis]